MNAFLLGNTRAATPLSTTTNCGTALTALTPRYGAPRHAPGLNDEMGAVDAVLFALEVIWARCVLAYRLLFALLRLDPATVAKTAQLDADDVQEALAKQIHQQAPTTGRRRLRTDVVLAVDIGGTRTQFLLADRRLGTCRRLPPAPTAQLWQSAVLEGDDKFDPAGAPARLGAYLVECGIDPSARSRGWRSRCPHRRDHRAEGPRGDVGEEHAVDETALPRLRLRRRSARCAAREGVGATADNLAAALGSACQHRELRSALVLVLGTAPARRRSSATRRGRGSTSRRRSGSRGCGSPRCRSPTRTATAAASR